MHSIIAGTNRSIIRVLALLLATLPNFMPFHTLAAPVATPGPDWCQELCLDNDGYWRQRLRLEIQNDTAQALAGESLEIKIGKGNGQADLEGASADALRLVNDQGNELLWAMTDAAGRMIRRGKIPANSILHIPAECPAQARSAYYLYFDNSSAWPVPDFLEVIIGLRNGGLEEGDGPAPAGWKHDETDAQHRAAWVTENPHSGKKCLKTVVAANAEPTWISTRQSQLKIIPGARYVMRAWVKAAEVKGWAGWYIHVGNKQNYMLISPMLDGGGGTYDWKEVRTEFVAPTNAYIADLGTVLRGTGTAWFDDVSLECLEAGKSGISARATKPERLEGIQEIGAQAPWTPEKGTWAYRYPVRLVNLSNQAISGLVATDLSGALARLNRQANLQTIRVMAGTREIAAWRLGKLLLFEGRAEPRTRQTYYVYLRAGISKTSTAKTGLREFAANPALPGGQTKEAERGVDLKDYARLLESPLNLARNPSFESGDTLPEQWSGGAANQRPAAARMGFAEPGLFGKRCVQLAYPSDAQPQWVGWRQDVPVQAGKTYLFAAWLKCQDLTGGLQLHAHLRNAAGGLCKESAMTGAGPALNGTTDWTLLSGIFNMPADAATFQMHLTMQAKGTAWHDGVILAEIVPGKLGQLETRQLAASRPAVWPVNPIVKVFQDDIAPTQKSSARITAARNDKEPLQIALRSSRAIKQVKVSVDAPVNGKGTKLTNITVGIVGYVPVDHPTSYYQSTSPTWHRKIPGTPGNSDGWRGWWPDPILPRDTFDLFANVTQPAWVTIAVPKDAPSGEYTGKVRFLAAGATLADLPFALKVWDFTVPDEMHVKAIYDARQHGAQWQQPGRSPEESRREFWRFMAERRVCPDTIHPAPSLRYEQGKVVADFAAFDRAAEYYFDTLKLPHAYTPWLFYCFGWGHPPSAKFGEQPYEGKAPFEGMDRRGLRPQFKQAYQACLKTYWDHLKRKGWDRKVVLYISDEPFDTQKPIREQMKALCEMIHEVDPAIPIYCSTWHHQPDCDCFLNVWGIGHYGVVPVDKLQHIRQTGARFWWTTDGQMCLDTPYCAVERLLPHYCFKYGAEAYEFWGIDWLTYDPYEFGWHSFIRQSSVPGEWYYVRYPNGDGYLAYPGAPLGQTGPVSSVRLEQAREGCEDYEYLYLLRERIAAAQKAGRDTKAAEQTLNQAQELVNIPNAGGLKSTRVLPNPDAVLEIKMNVAQAIEMLSK